MLHPFSSTPAPEWKDPKVRGLQLELQISPQPVKLSEVRQLRIKVTLTNHSKKGIELDFPNDQRIEIYLMNSAEIVLTKWSDNHAITDKPGTVLVNQDEHIEYSETISTRDLTPDKVFIAEAFFPKYPDLRVRQKFLTTP
jgi:CHASE2 domain-containing sensor protein